MVKGYPAGRQYRLYGATTLGNHRAIYESRVDGGRLESLRLALTYYVNHGYLTSGAVVLEQDVADGTLTMQIIEGKITQVNVEDTKWFRSSYFQSRVNLAGRPSAPGRSAPGTVA